MKRRLFVAGGAALLGGTVPTAGCAGASAVDAYQQASARTWREGALQGLQGRAHELEAAAACVVGHCRSGRREDRHRSDRRREPRAHLEASTPVPLRHEPSGADRCAHATRNATVSVWRKPWSPSQLNSSVPLSSTFSEKAT